MSRSNWRRNKIYFRAFKKNNEVSEIAELLKYNTNNRLHGSACFRYKIRLYNKIICHIITYGTVLILKSELLIVNSMYAINVYQLLLFVID